MIRLRRTVPVKVKLLTWEWTTNFDGVPSKAVLEKAFARDFPKTCKRLENGGRFVLHPMVNFNSAEGRKFRYLVVVRETVEPVEEKEKRLVPEQAWVYGAADLAIRSQGAIDNSGNYFVYSNCGDPLYLLVFVGGRLVHWSEEVGYVDKTSALLEQRIERFRRFMKKDDLLSRSENYQEIVIDKKSDSMFIRAIKDPFWKGLDLSGKRDEPNVANLFGMCGLLFIAVMVIGWFWYSDDFLKMTEIRDVKAVELDVPLETIGEEELRDDDVRGSKPAFTPMKIVEPSCTALNVKVRGVIQNKLFVGEVDGTHGHWMLGDSLNGFWVDEISRNQVALRCGKDRQVFAVR